MEAMRFPWRSPYRAPQAGDKVDSPRSLDLATARALSRDSGFDDAGVVRLPHENEDRDAERFDDWIHAGRAGSMHYLTRRDEQGRLVRGRSTLPFPWARSAIVCLASYNAPRPRSIDPAPEDTGWIARYAWSSHVDPSGARRPSDYHKVLLKRLRTLDLRLRERLGELESRAYVDTGPIVERALAAAAGLGWTAKNTCLINQQLGSFVFLGVLLTSLEVVDAERSLKVSDHCGSCTRCIDACPTNALIVPYQMDATRCISYLTIEHRGALDEELMKGIGRQVFGCDICQDVCPWNSPRRAPVSADPEMEPRPELVNPALQWLASMDESQFEKTFNGSPVRRTGFNGMRRNVAAAMGNSGVGKFKRVLEQWSGSADEGLSAAARWALRRLRSAPEREDGNENDSAGGVPRCRS
jgi:epoxyqueuosine reductase